MICKEDHIEIQYEADACPLCQALSDLSDQENSLADAEHEVEVLEDRVFDLNSEIDILEARLEDYEYDDIEGITT